MIEIIERKKDKSEVNTMSPLNWAYIGDNIFELYIRMNLINNTRLKPHNLHVEAVKHVRASSQANLLNKIEENLTDEEKVEVCKAATLAKAKFVKTSTGFGTGGANAHDVSLMRNAIDASMKVKASGGVRTLEDALKMVDAGAERIGASSGVQIMEDLINKGENK